MPWTPEDMQTALRPPTPLKLGRAESIGRAAHTGLLDTVRNWYGTNVPDEIKSVIDNLGTLGSILGLDAPMSAYAGGAAGLSALQTDKIRKKANQ